MDEAPADRDHEGSVRTRHAPVHYSLYGRGPRVFALHGLPGTRREFGRFAGALAERGLCTVAFDVPGFGASPAAPSPGWQHIPEALADAITALSTGPATLLAHSFGAHLAVYSAALAPSVRALALLAPAGLRPHRVVRQLGPTPLLRGVAASRAGRALFHAFLTRSPLGRGSTRAGSELVLALLASADFARFGSTFRALDLPVLLARADDDTVVEPSVVDELALAARQARVLRFADGGHGPQRRHAAAIADALAELVHGMAGTRGAPRPGA